MKKLYLILGLAIVLLLSGCTAKVIQQNTTTEPEVKKVDSEVKTVEPIKTTPVVATNTATTTGIEELKEAQDEIKKIRTSFNKLNNQFRDEMTSYQTLAGEMNSKRKLGTNYTQQDIDLCKEKLDSLENITSNMIYLNDDMWSVYEAHTKVFTEDGNVNIMIVYDEYKFTRDELINARTAIREEKEKMSLFETQ